MNESNEAAKACPMCGATVPKDAPRGLCPRCVFAEAATTPEATSPAAVTSEIPSVTQIAEAFPHLEVLGLIGVGGMGYVFKARPPNLDRFVALKLLPDQLARKPQFAERFNREGRVLAKLNHPNIVTVFDFGRAGNFYFLLMEFVDGVNLRQAMRAGRFSPSEALAIVPRICEALQYAHEQGILHRDIKPENILLDPMGRVKIADFGIAKLVDEDPMSVTLTGTGAALGTPHYMAPEQLETPSQVDHRADIYSLGVVFYELLTGELPLGRFAPPSQKTPVDRTVDDVVFRTLEKDRSKRYQSAGEMKTEVEHLSAIGADESPAAENLCSERSTNGMASAEESGGARPKPEVSFRAGAGAALVGTSLVLPLTITADLLSGHGGVGPGELWLTLGSVALPGLGGTLVGWLGLNEIRDGRGAVRGLPLALFATLTWPLLFLLAAALGLPALVLLPAITSGAGKTLGRMLMLVLPAGVLTFTFWAIYSTARWASSKPSPHERGMLKWIFAAVLILGMGMATATRPDKLRSSRGMGSEAALPVGSVELVAIAKHPSDGTSWLPNGTPSSEGPFESPGITNLAGPNQRAVEFIFRTHELPIGASEPDFEIEGHVGAEGHLLPSGAFHYVARFPAYQKTTTIRARVAIDPWETLAKDAPASGGGGSVSLVRGGQLWNIAFLNAIEDKTGNTILTITHNILNHDIRAVAVVSDGTERTSLVSSGGRGHLIATFVSLPRTNITGFRFQVRPYRRTEFANVMLEPTVDALTAGAEPLGIKFRVPKGHVATFALCRHEGEQHVAIPGMSGYVVAPDDESASGEVRLNPIPSSSAADAQRLRWAMSVASEEGPAVGVGTETFGRLGFLPHLRAPFRLTPPTPPLTSEEVPLTHPDAESPGDPTSRWTKLALVVAFEPRPRNLGAPDGVMLGGGTNWEAGLALSGIPGTTSPLTALNPKSPIRVTVTGVNLREEAGVRWLGVDYVARGDRNWTTVFRAGAIGFRTETRLAHLLEGRAGALSVRHDRAEIRLPGEMSSSDAQELREGLAESLTAQTMDVQAASDTPLFKQPIGDLGVLHATFGAESASAPIVSPSSQVDAVDGSGK